MNNAVRYQVMPPLSPEEYQELHDDIAQNGVIEPIHVDEEGVVIDGHHRSKIANELGLPCPVITHDDLDDAGKRSLAFTLNLKRRHLTREQRRSLLAESLKSDPQLSNREHAQRAGTSHAQVGRVRAELEKSGQVDQRSTSTGADGKSYPASHPKHEPEPEAAPAPPTEAPETAAMGGPNERTTDHTIITSDDLDELNTPPVDQPTPERNNKPPRKPITDDANRIGWEIRTAFEKLEKLTEDDRYNAQKEKMTPLMRGHLQYAVETATNVLDELTRKD